MTNNKEIRSKYLGLKLRGGWKVAGVERSKDSSSQHKRFYLEKKTSDGAIKHFSCSDNTMKKLATGERTVNQLLKNKNKLRRLNIHPHRNDIYYSYREHIDAREEAKTKK